MVDESIRSEVLRRVQGAASLNLAYVGITNGLFGALHEIAAQMTKAGLEPEVHLLAEGREAVIVGRKPARS